MCWHLIAKNNFEEVCCLSEITDMSKAWDFVTSMKQDPNVSEIIWSRHQERTGKTYDEPIHLRHKDGAWMKNDIVDWKKS